MGVGEPAGEEKRPPAAPEPPPGSPSAEIMNGITKVLRALAAVATCGDCVHYMGGKCDVHKDALVISPSAKYPTKCQDFLPRSETIKELWERLVEPEAVKAGEVEGGGRSGGVEEAKAGSQATPSIEKVVKRSTAPIKVKEKPKPPEEVVVLEEEKLKDLLLASFKGEEVEETYMKALREAVLTKLKEADREVHKDYMEQRERRKRKLLLLGEDAARAFEEYPFEEFIRDNPRACDGLLGLLIGELKGVGVEFITIETGRNVYEYFWAERSVLRESADKLLLSLAAKVVARHTSKLSLARARTQLTQKSILLTWDDLFDYSTYVPLANEQLLDLETLTIKDRVEGKFFRHKLNVTVTQADLDAVKSLASMDADAAREVLLSEAPLFKKVFYNVFPPDDKEEIERFEEALGEIFYPGVTRRFFIIEGAPGIGKSVISDALGEALGKLASHYSLRRIFGKETSRWSKGYLAGKLANLSSETTTSILEATDELKQLTGDRRQEGEEKNKPWFTFENRVKLYFFVNQLPQFRKTDEAVVERFYIIRARGENPLTDAPTIRDRIIREELKAVFKYMLWCYWRLKQRDFLLIHDLDVDTKRDILLEERSGVKDFVERYCERGPYMEEGTIINKAYRAYRKAQGREPVGRNTLYQELEDMGFEKARVRPKVVFSGLRVKRDFLKQLGMTVDEDITSFENQEDISIYEMGRFE